MEDKEKCWEQTVKQKKKRTPNCTTFRPIKDDGGLVITDSQIQNNKWIPKVKTKQNMTEQMYNNMNLSNELPDKQGQDESYKK